MIERLSQIGKVKTTLIAAFLACVFAYYCFIKSRRKLETKEFALISQKSQTETERDKYRQGSSPKSKSIPSSSPLVLAAPVNPITEEPKVQSPPEIKDTPERSAPLAESRSIPESDALSAVQGQKTLQSSQSATTSPTDESTATTTQEEPEQERKGEIRVAVPVKKKKKSKRKKKKTSTSKHSTEEGKPPAKSSPKDSEEVAVKKENASSEIKKTELTSGTPSQDTPEQGAKTTELSPISVPSKSTAGQGDEEKKKSRKTKKSSKKDSAGLNEPSRKNRPELLDSVVGIISS
uniref:Uncharacterized protein n=1 Tax=Setaria digitata TaxID=48799 RepID=A0A915PWB0_9BILA